MIMDTGRLSVEILFICLLSGSICSAQSLYATEGFVFEIVCPLTDDVRSISWTGPPNSKIYAVGNDVDTNIPFIAIKPCSPCLNSVLVIRNMTKDKEGQYECYKDKNTKSGFEVRLKRNPSDLKIINETTDSQVIGVEGHAMILVCTVKRGIPEGNITWSDHENVLAVNLSEHVYLRLTPKRSDNDITFRCTSYNNGGKEVENRQIKLLIYYRPNVTISTKPSKVIQEGQRLEMECLNDGNDPHTRSQWIRNETKVNGNNSILLIGNVNRTDAGKYTCCVSSRAGTNEETVTIEVHYPPAVIVENQQTEKKSYLLTCVAKGIPSNYVFYQWEHMTERNEHIRFVNGSQNGELTIYEIRDLYYQYSGTYLCNVSNNVPNTNGSIYQTGTTSLKIQGRPLFLTSNTPIHYGIYGKEGKIKLFVHSYPKYENITLSCKNMTLRMKSGDATGRYRFNETEVAEQHMIFDSSVKVKVYRIDIRIKVLQESDFTNMTILAVNTQGNATFTFQLKSAHGPEPPVNVSARPHMNSILVYWERGFDGGYPQTFVIEYKENQVYLSDEWNMCDVINDSMKETYSVTIKGLKFDTQYVLRIYSYNIMNKSQIIYTDHIRTQSEHTYNAYGYILLCVSILATLIVVVLLRTYRDKIRDVLGKSCRYPHNCLSSLNGEEQNNPLQPEVNSISASNQLYSSFDRQSGFQVNMQNDFQMVHNVSYTVSDVRDKKSTEKHNRATNCANFEEQKNQIFKNEFHASKDAPELNYVEVSFDPLPKHRQFFIHGEDERTPYADIDLSLKAEALPDSQPESSEDESNTYINVE